MYWWSKSLSISHFFCRIISCPIGKNMKGICRMLPPLCLLPLFTTSHLKLGPACPQLHLWVAFVKLVLYLVMISDLEVENCYCVLTPAKKVLHVRPLVWMHFLQLSEGNAIPAPTLTWGICASNCSLNVDMTIFCLVTPLQKKLSSGFSKTLRGRDLFLV